MTKHFQDDTPQSLFPVVETKTLTMEQWKKYELLLAKVNKVTAYHRHGQKIPKSALDSLSNYQIEVEKALGMLK